MGKSDFEFHPAAEAMPMMAAEEFRVLVESIRRFGQKETIKLYDGKIIDGRHRYRACKEVGVCPKTEPIHLKDDETPEDYVRWLNAERRQLKDKAWKELILKKRSEGKTERQIAKELNVSKTSVHRELSVGPKGPTELPAKVEGKDGKQYPAKKKTTRESKSETLEIPDTSNPRMPGQTFAEEKLIVDSALNDIKAAIESLIRCERKHGLGEQSRERIHALAMRLQNIGDGE